MLVAMITVLVGAQQPAYAADFGTVGPVYGPSTTAPTGEKPQSKLWVADGIWWGALFDSVSADFHIFRYDWAANTWSDTGTLIDGRTNIYLDALWDGTYLYVVSAGTNAADSTHSPKLTRFSYSAKTKKWTRSTGYPVTPMGNGGVEAAVIAKDSTGLLWATYTQGSKVYVVHSTPGDDRTWVPRYQVPTPAGQSSVDPDDISAIVSYDGNKIGVLWSNQILGIETMYWAWHQDGTSDQTWNLQVAYQQPEGADDHMNIKSLVGDSSGRVFAAAKTSMNGSTDPLINLLVLNAAGQWSATKLWTVQDQGTRAIVQIDTQAREIYAFAAAPCCSGGTIYYKKSGLDNPQFATGLGTPFISSAAHPSANNATSTKQNVNGTTGLLVMAGDDSTRTYLYNRLTLGGSPTDTTPPETTITSGPGATTTDSNATFAFTSSEAGSTFSCKLDGSTAAPCASPTNYTGLGVGAHTFTVAATDLAGNTDPTPATRDWSVGPDTTPPETTITSGPAATTTYTDATFAFTSSENGSTFMCRLDSGTAEACTSPRSYTGLSVGTHTFTVFATDFAGNPDPTPATQSWSVLNILLDDFSSGSFTAGGWEVRVGGNGTAAVVQGAVHPDDRGARLVSTSSPGSNASIRKTMAPHPRLTLSWDAKVESHSGPVAALAKFYSSSGRVLNLDRDASGALSLVDVGTTVPIGANLAIGQVARLVMTVVEGTTDSVTISIDGRVVYSSSTRDLGNAAFTSVRLGDDGKRRPFDYRVDNVKVTG